MNVLSPSMRIASSVVAIMLANAVTTRAASPIDELFHANEAVETIEVSIETQVDGQTISEPLALDLGLGFPLWLYPLGREPGQLAPFGASPTHASVGEILAPGEPATFTFSSTGDSGSDMLQSSAAMLADVRLSDISRVGLCSNGRNDWVLDSLDIKINGKPFVTRTELRSHIQDEQALAQVRLRELRSETIPIMDEAQSLEELVRSGLATEEEEQRLRDVDEVLVPKLQEQNRIERQLAGSYPWFLVRDFQSPWRNGHYVESMSVTLVAASHTGADTHNYLYYQTGGRKYLLTSPVNPLSSVFGPQVFPIDLIGGSATAGDLRGHAIGMLADGEPASNVPDRAHVSRMIVEVDGRVVYDSEESEIDRLSLDAVRLIPPAHLDETGNVVRDSPIAREAFVWHSGSALGLDLVAGGAEALPSPTDEAWPEPESGLVYEDSSGAVPGGGGYGDAFDPFPGEAYEMPGWSDVYDEGFDMGSDLPLSDGGWPAGDPWAGDPWADPWADPWGADPWGWHPPPSWLDVLAGFFSDHFGYDPWSADFELDEITADPIGEPVQIVSVGWETTSTWADDWIVRWDVIGDESAVQSYLVEVLAFRPHSNDPVGGVVGSAIVAHGQREVSIDADHATMMAEIGSDPMSVYLIARVCPLMQTSATAGPGQFGPAIPAVISHNPVLTSNAMYSVTLPGGIHDTNLLTLAPPLHTQRGVWTPAFLVSHLGFAFTEGIGGRHMVFRPMPSDEELSYELNLMNPIETDMHLAMHLAFLDDAIEVNNTATVTVEVNLQSLVSGLHRTDSLGPFTLGPSTIDDPQPMLLIEEIVEPLIFAGIVEPAETNILIRVTGGAADADHPPVLVGIRTTPDF
ncbi:hypothetical protein [Rubripirellula reticaptiva]|uniref:Uncharacterized protein n=1 Tax=Rubripirellula reticaptiva TaxID=2528013 RepID=A0A5C6EDV8_9BACT|nr:hypothetical protein [Rubripirellula reticaptiva]TWU46665.1 hypothetical protein Poly59_56380 [Rubripirellula reticaptiva]